MQVEREDALKRLRPILACSSGGRVSNAWATCPPMGDNGRKRPLIPHTPKRPHGLLGKGEIRGGMGPRPISQLAGQRPTKASIGSRPERADGHIGTETRPRLLREAAVGDIAQWGEP